MKTPQVLILLAALAGCQARTPALEAPPAAPASAPEKPRPAQLPSPAPGEADRNCVAIPGKGFCIDALEFTFGELAAFLDRHGNVCEKTNCYSGGAAGPLRMEQNRWAVPPESKTLPAVSVTWYGAQAACADLGRRLCTAQEWQAACGGPQNQMFPFGAVFSADRCNGYEHKQMRTVAVGSMAGCVGGYDNLFDMAGNVWEWTQTCSDRKCQVRGGSFRSYHWYVMCGHWDAFDQDTAETVIGFRCCRDTR